MGKITFKFAVPGKSKDESKDKSMSDESKESTESKDESTDEKEPTYSKAELGKGLITAVRSGDGEAVFEAWKKLQECTPSDE
jgi:hypothetical protein